MNKTSSPTEFLESLSAFEHGNGLTITGLVKKDPDTNTGLLFSFTTECNNSWTPIPVDMIENIEQVSVAACKDHQHPIVRIRLKVPANADNATNLYATLLQSSLKSSSQVLMPQGMVPSANYRTASPMATQSAGHGCVAILVPHCYVTGGTANPTGGYDGAHTECTYEVRWVCW